MGRTVPIVLEFLRWVLKLATWCHLKSGVMAKLMMCCHYERLAQIIFQCIHYF